MDFGALPRRTRAHVRRARHRWFAAASAWNGLAAELSVAAVGWRGLTLQTRRWLGPASTLMVRSGRPVCGVDASHRRKLSRRSQARAAAWPHEAPFAAIVPPPLIAANRCGSSLVA